MAAYVMQYEMDKYVITTNPVQEEGHWTWTDWLSRGVYQAGVRRLAKMVPEGVHVFPLILPDIQEIVKARFMVSFRTEEQLKMIQKSMIETGLAGACTLQHMDEEEDGVKTLVFYLLP